MKNTLWIGGYGAHSIARMRFEEGRLEPEVRFDALNASYLCVSDSRKRLYAVSETVTYRDEEGGSVTGYDIGTDGTLTQTCEQPTHGKDPCHLTLMDGLLLVSNFSSGSFTRFPVAPDGRLGAPLPVTEHADFDPQTIAHVHQILPVSDELYAVADLGLDRVFFYPRAALREEKQRAVCVMTPKGFGPRHMVFPAKGNTWHVLCELRGQLLTYRGIGSEAALIGRLAVGRSVGEGAASALRLSPDGRMLLATGREQGIFALYLVSPDGLPFHLVNVSTRGEWPRDAVFSPDGRYVLCANERSSTVTVFSLENGHADYVGCVETPHPTCLVFE